MELSGGRLHDPIDVRLNRLVVESDVTLLVGPVLPHEVIGFSGGNKYLFPGLSGQEMIDVTHWLGALITSSEIIGTRGHHAGAGTGGGGGRAGARRAPRPVRRRGPRQRRPGVAVLRGARAAPGPPRPTSRPRRTSIISTARCGGCSRWSPTRYPDLWTGAKGFYKVEPVVADGGEVVLYAPHITEIAAMHPRLMEIGYHCRDFFLAQWDRYRDVPLGELAHSTHLFGAGTYDPVRRVSANGSGSPWPPASPRTSCGGRTSATSRPTPSSPRAGLADPDALVVPDAGEVLYRLRYRPHRRAHSPG